MKKFLIISAILSLLLLCAACQAGQSTPPPVVEDPVVEEPAASEPAGEESPTTEPAEADPEEEAAFASVDTTDIYGNKFDKSIFEDYELTMVNIWGTYCGPCIYEMPDLGEMSANMPEGTQLVGVVADALTEEYIDLAISIVEETGADFPHLLPDKALFTFIYYNVVGMPTTVFVDSEGRLVGKSVLGGRTREEYEVELASHLELLRETTDGDAGIVL